VECLGPLRFRRWTAAADITSIRVEPLAIAGLGPHVRGLARLRVHGPGDVHTAFGYPQSLLEEVARRLAAAIGRPEVAVQAQRVDAEAAAPKSGIPRPPASDVVVERGQAEFSMTVPPMGLRGPAGSFLWFGIAFASLGVVSTTLGTVFLPVDQAPRAWLLPVGAGVFVLFGAGLAAAGFGLGRRRVRLAVVDGSLLLEQVSPWRVRREAWAAGEVTGVSVILSDLEAGDDHLREICIEARGRRPRTVLVGRAPDELEWIAAELRSGLRIPRRHT
jgi:hypothetical protein